MKSDWLKILLCLILLAVGTFPSTNILVDGTFLIRFSGALLVIVATLLTFRKSFVKQLAGWFGKC